MATKQLKYKDYFNAQGSGFVVTGALPIDVRQVVDTSSCLTDVSAWTRLNTQPYVGLIVSVLDEKTLYMCTQYTLGDYNNIATATWVKISGGDVDLSAIHKRIDDVSQQVIEVSTYAHSLGKAFIFKGPAIYNTSQDITADDSTYILHVDGTEVTYRPGNVYQTPDGKEWVFADADQNEDGTIDVSRWIELGSPYDITPDMFHTKHQIINASTTSPFVSVSTNTIPYGDTSLTTIYVDVSTSDLDTSTGYATTGFVTDNQLRTYMSWVVLDSDPEQEPEEP